MLRDREGIMNHLEHAFLLSRLADGAIRLSRKVVAASGDGLGGRIGLYRAAVCR